MSRQPNPALADAIAGGHISFGVWLIAGTWTSGHYPCRCSRARACWTSASDPDGHPGYWCPCWGRTDLAGLPAFCCAPEHPIHAKEVQPA